MLQTLSCLSYEFVAKKIFLTWNDISFGITHKIFSPISAIKHAKVKINKQGHYSNVLCELASLEKGDDIHLCLDKLIEAEGEKSIKIIKAKWLYIVLYWIYEHKSDYKDPLALVEEVYADFDYPQEITNFVRYMPLDGIDYGDVGTNEEQLIKKWEIYLLNCAKLYDIN